MHGWWGEDRKGEYDTLQSTREEADSGHLAQRICRLEAQRAEVAGIETVFKSGAP